MDADGRKGLGMEIGRRRVSQGDSPELKFGMFEIEDQANLEAGGAEVIEHAAHFMIGDPINGLGIDDDFAINDEVWNVFPDFDFTVVNGESALLGKWNPLKPEFNRERLLIGLFMETVTQCIVNGKGATDYHLGLLDMNPISSICVHPVNLRLDLFMPAAARRVVGGVR
jgi:hypothetical protein